MIEKFLLILVYLTSIPATILIFISFFIWLKEYLMNSERFNIYSIKYINLKNKYNRFKDLEEAIYSPSEYIVNSNIDILEVRAIILSINDFCHKYNKILDSISNATTKDSVVSSDKFIKNNEKLMLIDVLVNNNSKISDVYNDVLLIIEEVSQLLRIEDSCSKISLNGDYDLIEKCTNTVTNFIELANSILMEDISKNNVKTIDDLIDKFKNEYSIN